VRSPRPPFALALAAALATALAALPAASQARTLRACHVGHGCFPRIQDAVDAARAGDTVRIDRGTWRESVTIPKSKDRLRLVGDVKHPRRVLLLNKGLKGTARNNGVFVDGADGVTISGIYAKNFRTNGIFILHAVGYTVSHAVASGTGGYGIFAFNSKGGFMTRSEAFYNGDSGFYVGETPRQAKPRRTVLSHLTAWGNVLGYSGTNSRYVLITRSRFFNNGVGIGPNSLDSERFPPDEDNIIRNNDVYWNNFDYYRGTPFPKPHPEVGEIPFPVGVGILLFSGRGNVVENNRIFGNYLAGYAQVTSIVLKNQQLAQLENNIVRDNAFGLNDNDLNGRDIGYDGSGSGNCFENNTGVRVTVPADGSTIVPCSPPTGNTFSQDAQQELYGFAGDATHEANWIVHAHAPRAGCAPLEQYGRPENPRWGC
jgi:hypothetical protein